jgi:rRNA-processing protein FCF1
MKLSDIRIGVPLLRLETRIFHTTPRKPTAFERIILGMTERFAQNVSFNNISVERLFIDVLSVSDPGPLVTPTLSELMALDVIRCMGDIEALDTLILRDIEITERGQKMIAEDMLPARLMQIDEVFYYDPIRQKLLSESESKAYRPVKPKLSIDSSVFEDVFPEELIRSNIIGAGYRWLSSASHIERVESLSVETLWKDTLCSIEVDSGVLRVASNNQSVNDYLASIESDESYARFIEPTFDCNSLPVEDLAELNDADLGQTGADIQSISQALAAWPSDARFVIPGSNYDRDSIPAQAPARQAIVLYEGSHPTGILIEWNSERSGCKILINALHPVRHSLRVTDRDNLICRSINAKYGNEPRNVNVACRIPTRQGDNVLSEAISNLSELVKSSDSLSDQNALIFWQGESQFLKDHTRKLANSTFATHEIVKEYFSTLSDVERLNGRANRDAWLKSLWDILLGRLVPSEEIGLKDAEQLLKALAENAPYPAKKVSELLGVVVAGVKQPQSPEDLGQLIEVFRILDQAWSPAFPSKLFTRELTRSILEQFPDFDPKLISIQSALFDSLRELRQAHKSLSEMISHGGLNEIENDDDYISLIKSTKGFALSECANSWASSMDSLVSVLEDVSVLEGTQLSTSNSRIAEISKWTAKLIGSLDPRVRSVYVFDTSALIEHPQIVAEASQGELFVVTKRVIEELDDKKLNETLRSYVSEAVRNLRNISKEHIQFCDGDMSLLPSDYRIKGDNLILSVAVRYRKYKPVLITNDNNLSLKARAEGLEAMNAELFLKRLRPQKANEKSQDYPKGQKRNQGKQRRKR